MSTETENSVVREYEAKAKIYLRMYEEGDISRDECWELIGDLEDVTRIQARLLDEDVKIRTEQTVEAILKVISLVKSVL